MRKAFKVSRVIRDDVYEKAANVFVVFAKDQEEVDKLFKTEQFAFCCFHHGAPLEIEEIPYDASHHIFLMGSSRMKKFPNLED